MMTEKEEIERLRRKIEEIHEISQQTGVEQWQLLDNIAATAASALRLPCSYIDEEDAKHELISSHGKNNEQR